MLAFAKSVCHDGREAEKCTCCIWWPMAAAMVPSMVNTGYQYLVAVKLRLDAMLHDCYYYVGRSCQQHREHKPTCIHLNSSQTTQNRQNDNGEIAECTCLQYGCSAAERCDRALCTV